MPHTGESWITLLSPKNHQGDGRRGEEGVVGSPSFEKIAAQREPAFKPVPAVRDGDSKHG